MYRNDEKKADADKWQLWTNILQGGSLVFLLVGVIGLGIVPKETAQTLVLWWAGIMFILATVAFIVASISVKKTAFYFQAEGNRVGKLIDEAIEAERKK